MLLLDENCQCLLQVKVNHESFSVISTVELKITRNKEIICHELDLMFTLI